MADEVATNEKVNASPLPDSVLEEMEKISKLEKDLQFLQFRQGSVERTLDELTSTKDVATVEEKNVIQDEQEETATEETKKNTVKKDKLKANLESVEKKRYENIGIEFAKGSEKVFNEIRKSQELKKKMTSTKVQKLEQDVKKEESEKTEEKKKGFSIIKLTMAITAVSGILYLFRDKIDEIIPGFASGYENALQPIKNIGNRLFGDLFDNISIIFNDAFKTIFEGNGGVRQTFNEFFLNVLPNVMYQSGIALFSAFGGSVSTQHLKMSETSTTIVDNALYDSKEQKEALKRQVEDNQAIRNSPFSSPGEEERAYRQLARDLAFQQDLMGIISKLYGVDEQVIQKKPNYSSAFVTFLNNEKISEIIDKDGNVSDEQNNRKLAEAFYAQSFNKPTQTQDFSNWYDTKWKDNTSKNWGKLNNFAKSFNESLTNKGEIAKRKKEIETLKDQIGTTIRKNVAIVDENNKNEVKLNVQGKDVAQDAFAAEVQSLFETFKGLYGGDNKLLIEELTKSAVSFIQKVIEDLIQPLVDGFGSYVTEIYGRRMLNTTATTEDGKSVQDYGKSHNVVTGQTSPSQYDMVVANRKDYTNPVILIDLELNGGILQKVSQMFVGEAKLLQLMEVTNKRLENIKELVVSKKVSTDDKKTSNETNENKSDKNKTGDKKPNVIVEKFNTLVEKTADRVLPDIDVVRTDYVKLLSVVNSHGIKIDNIINRLDEQFDNDFVSTEDCPQVELIDII